MGEKQPRSDHWRRFWHWHGFEIVIILALAVGYAAFFFRPRRRPFLGTVPVLRPFLLSAPLRFMMVLSSAPLTALTLVGVTVLTLAFLQANPFHLQALLMVLTAVPILPPAMTSAMDASIPVDGFLAILTAIFLSTPKSMSMISLTTSFIRSRMSIQMI